ncbi:MAG: cyclic-di-AMP receptor [Bacillota bacterium]|nr:cyclic-di-AMP receptor [Bacillota bacterium]
MKLVMAVVNDQIAPGLVEKLVQKNIPVTRLASSGGFLRHGSTTLMSGVEGEEVQVVIQTIKDYTEKKKLERLEGNQCPDKVKEGLATVFIMPIEKMLHL